MMEAGILREGEPIELIDGLLVYKDRSAQGDDPMTIGKKHNLVIKLLAELDRELERLGCHMQTQGPVTLSSHDEPEPDALVLRGRPRAYAERLPTAEDAEAVIEVADSSLEADRGRKLELYARARSPQYLIVNLRDSVIEVHDTPVGNGYSRTTIVREGGRLSLRAGADRVLEVEAAQILP
jgi:Uma2 family endonuclease